MDADENFAVVEPTIDASCLRLDDAHSAETPDNPDVGRFVAVNVMHRADRDEGTAFGYREPSHFRKPTRGISGGSLLYGSESCGDNSSIQRFRMASAFSSTRLLAIGGI